MDLSRGLRVSSQSIAATTECLLSIDASGQSCVAMGSARSMARFKRARSVGDDSLTSTGGLRSPDLAGELRPPLEGDESRGPVGAVLVWRQHGETPLTFGAAIIHAGAPDLDTREPPPARIAEAAIVSLLAPGQYWRSIQFGDL